MKRMGAYTGIDKLKEIIMKNTLLILCFGILLVVATVINMYADNGGSADGSGTFNAKVIKPLKMTVHPDPPTPSYPGIVIPRGTTRSNLPVNWVEFQISGEANAEISLDNTAVPPHNTTGLSVVVNWQRSEFVNPWQGLAYASTAIMNATGHYFVRVYFNSVTATADAQLGLQHIFQQLTVEYIY